jgi:hypothetical protein
MPSNSNSTGSLEVSSLSLPVLNDRLRRIGSILSSLTGGTTSSSTTSTTASASVNQIVLTVPGILAVQSNVAPILELASSQTFKTIVALVKIAPIGSPITVQLYVNGAEWGPVVTIAAGAFSGSASISGAGPIAANAPIRLDITGVGATLTGVSYPGSDLTVLVR